MAITAAEPPTHSELRDNSFPDSIFDDPSGEEGIALTSAEIKMLLEQDDHPKEGESEGETLDQDFLPKEDQLYFDPQIKPAVELKDRAESQSSPLQNNGMGGKRSEKLPPAKKFMFETFFDPANDETAVAVSDDMGRGHRGGYPY